MQCSPSTRSPRANGDDGDGSTKSSYVSKYRRDGASVKSPLGHFYCLLVDTPVALPIESDFPQSKLLWAIFPVHSLRFARSAAGTDQGSGCKSRAAAQL